jgi:catechol 2,3-dioxygenase
MTVYKDRIKNFQNGNDNTLHPQTRLGYVHLTVSDLERSLAFYTHSLGFQIRRREGDTLYLGAGKDELLVLSEHPGAALIPRRSGLYHLAILVPSRLALAQSLRRLIDNDVRLQGGADHLVSEAVYLSDPDGNGIEIYRDRPRSAWEYENGNLKMGTEALDYQGVLDELLKEPAPWHGLHLNSVLGHMHLHVASLPEAVNFYETVLGFDLTLTYRGSAAFLSSGGYHHHVAVNTWNGFSAAPPPPDSVGLRYFSVQLPTQADMDKLFDRLQATDVPYEESSRGLLVRDPSQNGVLVEVQKITIIRSKP